jgi:hypothetical protein
MISEPEELVAVNRCRLFLKAFFLSDIVNGSGTEILPAAWNGERIICPQRSENWPNQSRPPPSAWAIWKFYLRKRFLGRGLRLKSPMGPWVKWDQDWPWYFCPEASAIFHHDRGLWTRHPAVQLHSVRPSFSLEGVEVPPPVNIFRATVESSRNYLVCLGYGRISIPNTLVFPSFLEYLHHQAREKQMEWCTEFVSIIGQVDTLIEALQQGQVHIVSDGSFVQPFAMAAFVMENETRECCVTNRIIVPGSGEEMSAYRGEVSGILASLFFVNHLCSFFHIQMGSITMGCDGEGALYQSFHEDTPQSIDTPSFDLLMAIHRYRSWSSLRWQTTWIKDIRTTIRYLTN